MILFRKVQLEDQEVFKEYMRQSDSRSCENTFGNLYLWAKPYQVTVAVVEDTLVAKASGEEGDEKISFSFPRGTQENVQKAVDALLRECRENGWEFRMHSVTREQFDFLEQQYPGMFQAEYHEDYADYVYEREKLAALSGKKYHGKKNHVNKFMKSYPDWSYEPITDANVEECFQMALVWRRENGCEEDPAKNAEMCVALNSLRLMKELHFDGGLLRVGGKVVAFTMGEPVTADTYNVHIEKACSDVSGAYTMINQQFVQHALQDYLYVNREEDLGEEGLRKAKQSYRPVFMVEKGIVTLKK